MTPLKVTGLGTMASGVWLQNVGAHPTEDLVRGEWDPQVCAGLCYGGLRGRVYVYPKGRSGTHGGITGKAFAEVTAVPRRPGALWEGVSKPPSPIPMQPLARQNFPGRCDLRNLL